jgi:hypothetical protein
LTLGGHRRYWSTRRQLESGTFQPAGFLIDLLGIFVAMLGLAPAACLVIAQVQT